MVTAPEFPNPMQPPVPLRVFAPNGDRRDFLGWLCVAWDTSNQDGLCLFVVLDQRGNKTVKLSRKVVVQNIQIGVVIYDPRKVELDDYFTDQDWEWLEDNPEWPDILEVYDKPVVGSEAKPREVDEDGIYG